MAELVVFQLTREEQVSLSDGPHTGILENRLYLTKEGAQLVVAQQIQRLGYQPAEAEWKYDPDKGEWRLRASGLYWRIQPRSIISTHIDDIENAPVDRMGADRPPQSAQKPPTFRQRLLSWVGWLLLVSCAVFCVMGVLVAMGFVCQAAGYC